MKKYFLLLFLVFSITSYAQFPLDFQTINYNLVPLKLSNTETKYVDISTVKNDNYFSLYNLDGSLNKMIQLPPKPEPSAQIEIIDFITNSLFDNDPSNIEYLVHYDPCDSIACGAPWMVKIIREDGTILMDAPNASYSHLEIFSTEEGTKLKLAYYFHPVSYPDYVRFYSLPGALPTAITNFSNHLNDSFTIYPNPNNGSFFIKVNSDQNNLISYSLYNEDGILVDSFMSCEKTIKQFINNIPSGVYLLKSISNTINQTEKLIIQK